MRLRWDIITLRIMKFYQSALAKSTPDEFSLAVGTK